MDSKYKQEVQKFGKKDAIIALCVFVVLAALITFFDWLRIQGFHGCVVDSIDIW